MTVHILGVCGSLMTGVACLASEKGFEVIGYDVCFQPPMSTVLESKDIKLVQGYPDSLSLGPEDMIIVGNHLRRSDNIIQWLIQRRVKLYSAPEWLMDFILRDRQVIAVTGSHGKTTITTMIAWILEQSGYQPGYLIGGVSSQLDGTASLGKGPYFVIEADEYDTAFFDKRPKFVHYWPTMLVISNIEYDHADIYSDVDSIIKQYSYLLRLLPNTGCVVSTNISRRLQDVIEAFHLKHIRYGAHVGDKQIDLLSDTKLKMIGTFNQENALAAYLIAKEVGIAEKDIKSALETCIGPARRQMLKYNQGGITAYDDFAHHPSELSHIVNTFQSRGELIVLYHPATYTQRQGLMDNKVIKILKGVKLAIILLPNKHELHVEDYKKAGIVLCNTEEECVDIIMKQVQPKDQIIATSSYYLRTFWETLTKKLEKLNEQITV